ncbi:spondin-1 [Lucilia sericata]|uniref:spondin-1 n=1 Tax=Lucilia sericata TaxID=13632 RepID=UPI0018A8188B|nr:spondin-1 [Lucilia sericata]
MNWLSLAISISATLNIALACSRVPTGTTAAKSPADESYVVSVAGNPQTYIPGQKYNVSIIAYNDQTFISFMLGLESESGGGFEAVGSFEIVDLAETRYSPRCANLVENTNTNIKSRIDVVWVAPASSNMGCVLLRATIVQHRDVWFMDDGFLTKRMCEEEVDDIDTQPSITEPCCACYEAKYELTFEGKWSRHTHPKDFPANSWQTRFSDIIGASHTVDYRFWEYGKNASEGLREVAEHGSTRTLESELKEKSDQIRTIIKARGITYPNITGKTFAVFRVDSKHHLISLVSMIDPSPDWIVGVSGLELCLPNCTWVEKKVHNLYPWDAGTDSGPSYTSADQPQLPPDVIRRIKPNFPNDPRSPFYDPSGAPMKPLATLYINRRRLYEKTCDKSDDEDEPPQCDTTAWSRWDECSAECGPGKQYRTREFKNAALAWRFKCRTSLREEQDCTGSKCNSFDEEVAAAIETENLQVGHTPETPECAISDWGEWSSCSVSCGIGTERRTRHYLNPRAKKKCQQVSRVRLQEQRNCKGVDCGGDINGNGNKNNEEHEAQVDGTRSLFGNIDNEIRYRDLESLSQKLDDYIPPECGVSHWSDFSPCLGPCGGIGTSERLRVVWNNDEVYGVRKPDHDDNLDPCRHIKRREVVNCTIPSCDAIVPTLCYEDLKVSSCRDSDVTNYWFYDHMSDQCAIFWADKCDKNRNKFPSKEACEETCRQPRQKMELQSESLQVAPIDCLVSDWVSHACNATCGDGVQIKTRKVLRSPKYGGKPCPKHLVRLEKCYQRCEDIYSVDGYSSATYTGERRRNTAKHHFRAQEKEKSECRYSEWSVWTPCTVSCGNNSYRQKTRTLLNTDLSYKCKDRVRIEKCSMLPCLLNSNDDTDKW